MAMLTAQITCQNGERKDFTYAVGDVDSSRVHSQMLEALGSLQSRLNEELTIMVEAEKAANAASGDGGKIGRVSSDDKDDDEDEDDDEEDDAEPSDKKAKT